MNTTAEFLRAPRASLGTSLLLFLLLQFVLLPVVFGDALRGRSLLAPIDIAPAFFPKYAFVDPGRSPVPANHFVIDGLTYDLPLQRTVFDAYRRGEIPWWDPYSLGGRPLLADAHVNATDPVRVALYRMLPFELAFNWTRVLHFLIGGLGAFVLLLYFRFPLTISIPLAVAFQFAGGFVMFFSHPWIQASFLFYPFLWLLWDGAWRTPFGWRDGVAALAVAGVFYSGNVQSHAYLLLFALAFCLGYCGRTGRLWKRGLRVVAPSALMGACLAAPVLLHQLELYVIGVQLSSPERAGASCVVCTSGVFSLSAVYPWMLGTFRSLDIGKLAGESGLGFMVYPGSVVFCLAVVALLLRRGSPLPNAQRMAAWLLAIYFVAVLSTPLKGFLYTRSSGLALLAFPVLAAFAVKELRCGSARLTVIRRFGVSVMVGIVALVTVLHVVALLIYPTVIDRVRAFVLPQTEIGTAQVHLREFQIQNLPREVTFSNPEPLLAAVALLALGFVLMRPALQRARYVWLALLVINVVPMLLFARRFIPRQPVEMWHRLEAGGPEQNRVRSALHHEERLFERAPHVFAQVFPFQLQNLQGVRVTHGYAALQPHGIASPRLRDADRWSEQFSDWIYESTTYADSAGVLRPNRDGSLARFFWRTGALRQIVVESIGLQHIRLTFAPGNADDLLWTDSPYPGWRAELDGRVTEVRREPPFFTVIPVRAGTSELVLRYTPSYLVIAVALALLGSGAAGTAVLYGATRGRQRRTRPR